MRVRNVFRAAACLFAVSVAVAGPVGADPKPKEWNPVIVPADFVAGVDNPFFPLVPGRTNVYRSETKDGVEEVQFEVTHRQKTVLGVTTMVVIESETLDGVTVEVSENWFAQDREGNVWYFGEFSQSYENGQPVSTEGSWEAGVNGARPGIIMLADPTGGGAYFQEHAEGVAEDMASVIGIGRTVTTPLATYWDVLATKEWNPLESGSVEHKYYARGVGLILAESGSEKSELVAIR
jgi:hypothetical protein